MRAVARKVFFLTHSRKTFPQYFIGSNAILKTEGIVMHRTSDSRNHEITEIKLSIGQCKLLERILDEKLYEIETGTSDFNEKPLKALVDVFEKATEETAAEQEINEPIRSEKFRAWASGEERNAVQHG